MTGLVSYIMSIHIAAKQGEIADKILLPGDPLRAKFIAENFLEDAVCFNEVRNNVWLHWNLQGPSCICHGNRDGECHQSPSMRVS